MSDEQMNDSTFGRLFILMILAMTVLSIILVVLAGWASSDVDSRLDERSAIENTQAVAERIAPIGTFSADTVADAPTVAIALTGEQAYASCAACHANGTLGAPILGDAGVWSERLSKGLDTLYKSAISGIGSMPAKGGNIGLSDDDVRLAVDYMLEQSK